MDALGVVGKTANRRRRDSDKFSDVEVVELGVELSLSAGTRVPARDEVGAIGGREMTVRRVDGSR